MKYKSNNNIVYSCKYHVVFCPKYRRKVLNNGVDERLKANEHGLALLPSRLNRREAPDKYY